METSSSSNEDTGQGCPARVRGPLAPGALPPPAPRVGSRPRHPPRTRAPPADCAGSEELASGEGGGDSLPVRCGIHGGDPSRSTILMAASPEAGTAELSGVEPTGESSICAAPSLTPMTTPTHPTMENDPKTRPDFSPDQALQIAESHFGVSATKAGPLPSDRDQNFVLTDEATGRRYVLKLSQTEEDPQVLDFQNRMLEHLARAGFPLSKVLFATDGREVVTVTGRGRRGLSRPAPHLGSRDTALPGESPASGPPPQSRHLPWGDGPGPGGFLPPGSGSGAQMGPQASGPSDPKSPGIRG